MTASNEQQFRPVNFDRAAYRADWTQVALNGGPPCFHIENDRFCLRADRWAGHPSAHEFVSLAALLDIVREQGAP